MAYEFVFSGVIMGIVLVATAAGLALFRDWKRYVPGNRSDEREASPMRLVYLLLATSLLAILAVVANGGVPMGDGGITLYIVGLGAVLTGYLGYGVYAMVRSHGRKTSEAVMAGAWALGAASLVGLTVLLILG